MAGKRYKLVQRKVAEFANRTNESGWETLAQRRMIARLCALYKAYTVSPAWKVIGDSLLKPCYSSRDDHGRKIRSKKQRTDAGKYSFVNRAIKDWNRLPACVIASFPCKLNTFRKRVRDAVTSKEPLGGSLNGNK
jgi:hypothetical protein